MSHAGFVHLHVHSSFSLAEGTLHLKDVATLSRDADMPAIAVTDTNNLFGVLEFVDCARDMGVQPIIGCQVSFKEDNEGSGGRRANGASGNGNGNGNGSHAGTETLPVVVLLVQSETGYKNLLALVSNGYLSTDSTEGFQLRERDLKEHSEGLLLLTGGTGGPVNRLLEEGHADRAEALLERLASAFPGRLYVELMRHGQGSATARRIEDILINLAYRHDVPLVAANDAYFADESMHEAQDILLCIAEGAHVAQKERRRLTIDHRFKSAQEMQALFADVPEAIANTITVAQRCAYVPGKKKPILPPYPKLEGRDEEELLREMTMIGLEKRLEDHVYQEGMNEAERKQAAVPYRERCEYEAGVIAKMGYAGYFLIVADFIGWARGEGIPVGPGRGSGAGSAVAWALMITDLDPLRWGLMFERFLNPDRISMPDFDIDFCAEGRDRVIRYVQNEYGSNRVAQIITFGKMEARAVLRDVGRALGVSYSEVDQVCKLVEINPAAPVKLKEAAAGPEFKTLIREKEHIKDLVRLALKLEGMYRHASTHAAGVVISDRPLEELVPLYRDPRSDMPVTQYNMEAIEAAGLVKFDFLGLKTLTILDRTTALLAEQNEMVDLRSIPLDDEKTLGMLGRGETVGVFQLEGAGMREVVTKLKPDRFEDIIALVALYRPGPMDNIPSYIRRKHGQEEISFLDPILEEVLAPTYGLAVYQEQVMEIAQVLAGYALGEADILRRAMSKKKKSEMEAQRERFISGATENGISGSSARNIFEQVEKFAGYGFNKSHAAAYGLIAWQTAYMKAHYPVEFIAASMTMAMGQPEKVEEFRAELKNRGAVLLSPDIQKSGVAFRVERQEDGAKSIRYALAAIRRVGAEAMEAVVREREKNGPFSDIFEMVERVESTAIRKSYIEYLAKTGAFDSLLANRRQASDAAEILAQYATSLQRDRDNNQANLFGNGNASASAMRPLLPEVADWSEDERLAQEYEALGCYLSGHPLELAKPQLDQLGVVSWSDINSGKITGSRHLLAGVVLKRRFRSSRSGEQMATVTMSDPSGTFTFQVFPEFLSGSRNLLEDEPRLLVEIEISTRDDGTTQLTAGRISSLEAPKGDGAVTANSAAQGLKIVIREAVAVDHIARVIEQHGSAGGGYLNLVVDGLEREVEMDLAVTCSLTTEFRAAIKASPGVLDVMEV